MLHKLVLSLLVFVCILKTDAQTSVLAVADEFLEKGNYQLALEQLQL